MPFSERYSWPRLIHTFAADSDITWLNFDCHWLCVCFGSCENRRLTQSWSSGVLHGWSGVKLQIKSAELNLVKRRTSHEPNWLNSPFPSSLVPLFQNESKRETFHMKMSSAWSFIFMQIKVIFIRMVSYLDSPWNRGTRELGNGLLGSAHVKCGV